MAVVGAASQDRYGPVAGVLLGVLFAATAVLAALAPDHSTAPGGSPGPSSASVTTPSGPAAGVCPDVDALRRVESRQSEPAWAGGDVNGDGRQDRFVIYPSSDGSYSDLGSARIRAEFGGGGVVDVPAQTLGSGAEVVGTVDVDGDGRDEIIVDPHGGATAHGVGLVVVKDCRPHEVTAADGTVFELLYYQNSLCCPGEAVGVDCVDVTGDSAVELVATSNTPSGEWSYVAYDLDAGHAFEVARARGRGPTGKPANVRFSWGFECRGYHYPDGND